MGPQTTKDPQISFLFLAKATQMFRLLGKEIDNSVYFTLYGLGKVAESFKKIGPYHTPIQYDRTKVWSLSKRWAEKPTSQLRIKEKMGW